MNLRLVLAVFLAVVAPFAFAEGLPVVSVINEGNQARYSVSLELLALMSILTLLPSMLLMMTPFIRIIIVMSLLRQALGTGQTPPNQVLVGLSLFLSFFIMAPVLTTVYEKAVVPYMNNTIGMEAALTQAQVPVRSFMMNQTRQEDISAFAQLTSKRKPMDSESLPFFTLVPAFITSELKSAFTIGFLIYIPFVVIDLVVASILMSLGMMMLSPMMISMPFKLMLFVLVDGWSLTVGSLAASFVMP